MKKKTATRKRTEATNSYEGREGLVYVRVSSKKQELEGHGREGQDLRCRNDLEKIGVPYKRSFMDTFSGWGDFMKRPAMNELLDYIDANQHKKFVVVFDDLKRLARDTVQHLALRTAFKARNVELRCLNYNLIDSPEGMFVETVLSAGNELERHQNRRQVIQKMKARLEAGYWPFTAKRGYKMIKDPLHGKLSVKDETSAEIVKTALEGFSTGRFIRRIDACRYLIKKGFWKKNKGEKYTDLFSAMLRDPFYMGEIEYPKWEVARRKGHHEALISVDTFGRNQKRLRAEVSGKKIRNDASEDFPLRGLITCAECKGHLCGAWTTKKRKNQRYPYYFCQNRECKMFKKSLRRDEIEGRFNALLREQRMKENVDKLVKTAFDRAWKEEMVEITNRSLSFLQEKEKLTERSRKLTDIILSATSDKLKQGYEKELEATLDRIDEIDKGSDEKTDYGIPYRTALNKATGMLRNAHAIWGKLSLEEKQKLFFFIFLEKLPYDKNLGYRTAEKLSAIRLFEGFATSKPDNVESAFGMASGGLEKIAGIKAQERLESVKRQNMADANAGLVYRKNLMDLAKSGDPAAISEIGFNPNAISAPSQKEMKEMMQQKNALSEYSKSLASDMSMIDNLLSDYEAVDMATGQLRGPFTSAGVMGLFKVNKFNDFMADASYLTQNLALDKVGELSDRGIKLTPISEFEIQMMGTASSPLVGAAEKRKDGTIAGFKMSSDKFVETMQEIRNQYSRVLDSINAELTLSPDEYLEILNTQ